MDSLILYFCSLFLLLPLKGLNGGKETANQFFVYTLNKFGIKSPLLSMSFRRRIWGW